MNKPYAERAAAMKHLSLTIKPVIHDQLKDKADSMGITVAGLIKGILGEYLLGEHEKDKGGK